MQRLIRMPAAILAVMMPGLTAARADVLPAAGYYASANSGQYNSFNFATTAATVTAGYLAPGITNPAAATIGAGGISVSSQGGGNGSFCADSFLTANLACGSVSYYAEIAGPAGMVPVDITGSGTLNTAGQTVFGGGELR